VATIAFFCVGLIVMVVGFILGKKIGEGMSIVLESPYLGITKWVIAFILWFVVTPWIGKDTLNDVAGLIGSTSFIPAASPTFMLNVGVASIGFGILFGRVVKVTKKEEKKTSIEEDSDDGEGEE